MVRCENCSMLARIQVFMISGGGGSSMTWMQLVPVCVSVIIFSAGVEWVAVGVCRRHDLHLQVVAVALVGVPVCGRRAKRPQGCPLVSSWGHIV